MEHGTALVTGGNSGIGLECARELARRGWRVVIASRDREASAAAVERIRRESGNSAVEERGLDLASLAGVRTFVADLEGSDLPLRALVCNAGLQVTRGLQRSAEGHELTFAVNHLGHFLLVNLLLRRLAAHGPARVVVVASGVHDPKNRTGMPKASVTDVRSLATANGEYDGRLAYVHSKLCNVWFTYELARRLAGTGLGTGERAVTVNAFDPGLVPGSRLARDYPAALQWLWHNVGPGLARVLSPALPGINPANKAGAALARLAADASLAGTTGKYFSSLTRWRDSPSSEASYDVGHARALWEESVRLTGLAAADSPLVPR